MRTTDELYGSQFFDDLYDAGAITIYELHIDKLDKQLTVVTGRGDYHVGKKIQEAQDHFRALIKQVLDRRECNG